MSYPRISIQTPNSTWSALLAIAIGVLAFSPTFAGSKNAESGVTKTPKSEGAKREEDPAFVQSSRAVQALNFKNLDLPSFLSQVETRLYSQPDNPTLLEVAGIIQFQKNDFALAEAYFAKLKRLSPIANRLLALSFYEQKEYRKALPYFQKIPAPMLQEDWEKYALTLQEAGKKADAVKEFEAYRLRYPKVEAGLEFLAQSYRHPLQKEKLLPLLELQYKKLASSNTPEESKVALELADLYGEAPRALELRARVLALAPQEIGNAKKMVGLLESKGDFKKAVELCEMLAPNFSTDIKFNQHLATLWQKFDRNKAIHYLEIVQNLAPKEADPLLELAKRYEENKQLDKAIEAYQGVLHLNPNHAGAKEKLLALGPLQKEQGSWLETLQKTEAKNPKDHALQFQLAQIFQKKNDRDNAYKYLKRALANAPSHTEYTLLLPLVIHTEEQLIKHFPTLQTLAQKGNNSPELYLLLARGYARFKNHPRSAEAIAEVYRLAPKMLDSLRQPILEVFTEKNYTLAGPLSENYTKVHPKDLEIRQIWVASLAQNNVPPTKLRKAIQDLLFEDPAEDKWLLRLAELDLDAKDSAGALQHGQAWLRQYPDDKKAYHLLEPLSVSKKGQEEFYLQILDNLVRLEPSLQNQYEQKRAEFLFQQGNFPGAVESYSKLSEVFPGDAKVWFRLGQSYAKLGRDNAFECYQKACQLAPTQTEYARAFAILLVKDEQLTANIPVLQMLRRDNPKIEERQKLARAYSLRGEYASAGAEWDWFLSNANNIAVSDTLAAKTYLKLGATAKARPLLEKRLQENSHDLEVMTSLSDIYQREGNKPKQIAMMEKVVQEDFMHEDYLLRLAKEKEKAGLIPEALHYYGDWALRHEDDVPTLIAYQKLAEKYKDTTSLIEALRYLGKIKNADPQYQFQLAEIYYSRSGELQDIEELSIKYPNYRKGKLILVREYHEKRALDKLAPLLNFVIEESKTTPDLLEALGDIYAYQKKYPLANQIYFDVLLFHKKDRDLYEKVYTFAIDHQSPHLKAILQLGAESFGQDEDLQLTYAKSLGQTNQALTVYQTLLQKQPNNLEWIVSSAELAKNLQRLDLAAKWYEQYAKLKSQDLKPWKNLVEIYTKQNDKLKLVHALEGLYAQDAGNSAILLQLAGLYEGLQKFDKAIGYYRAALYLNPKDKAIREKMIALLHRPEQKEQLAEVLNEMQSLDTSAHEAQFELAKIYWQQKNKERAYAYASSALEQSPQNHNYQNLLPRTIHSDEQILKHFALLNEIAERPETHKSDVQNADLYYLLAHGYALKQQWDNSAKYYSLIQALDSKRLIGKRDAILALFQGKNFNLTADLTEKYFDLNQDFDREIRQCQIMSFEKTHKEESAIRKSLQLLLAVDKDNAGGLLRLADLDLRAKDTASALTNIRTCLTTHANELRAYQILLPLVDKKPEQRVSYVVVLEKLAELDTAGRSGHLLKLAYFHFDRKNYREAAKLLNEVTAAQPKNALAWYRFGQCRHHLGVTELAIQSFAKAYKLEPDNLEYARTYAQTFRSDKAVKEGLALFEFLNRHQPYIEEKKNLAKAYFFNGDYVSSAKVWDITYADPKSQEDIYPWAGETYWRVNQFAKAAPIYAERSKREPGRLELLDTLVMLYTKTKDQAKYISALEKIVEQSPAHKNSQLQLAQIYDKNGKFSEALNAYGQWVGRNSEDIPALKAFHRLAMSQKDTASLETSLRLLTRIRNIDNQYSFQLTELNYKFSGELKPVETMVKNFPQFRQGKIIISREYYRRGDFPKLAIYEKFMSEESAQDKNWLAPLAETYSYQNKKALAHKAFYEALVYLKQKPNTTAEDLHNALDKALIYGEANQSPYLVDILNLGYQSFPKELSIQSALAKALGNTPRALDLYLAVLQKTPEDMTILQNAARLAIVLNKDGVAIELLNIWATHLPEDIFPWQQLTKLYEKSSEVSKMENALEAWQRLQPSDADLTYKTGLAAHKIHADEKALEYFTHADELKPKTPTYIASLTALLSELANALVAKGETDKAAEYYGILLEKEPNHPKANLYLGLWLGENKDYAEAENKLKLGLTQSNNEPRPILAKANKSLGECYTAHGNLVEAYKAYQKAFALNGKDVQVAIAKMEIARSLSLTTEIPNAYSDILLLDSNYTEAAAGLAQIRFQEKNFIEAATLYRRVSLTAPEDKFYWTQFGLSLNGIPKKPEAKQALQKAFDLGERAPELLRALVELHESSGTLTQAEPVLDELILAEPGNAKACAWLGQMAWQKGNAEKAEEMFSQAIQLDPNEPSYSEGLADIFLQREDVETVIEMLEPIQLKLSANGQCIYAEALLIKENYPKAKLYYQNVLNKTLLPRALAGMAEIFLQQNQATEAKRLLEGSTLSSQPPIRLALARAYLALHESDKAFKILKSLVQNDDKNFEYHNQLGLVYLDQKQYASALKEFSTSLEIKENNPSALYHSGLALMQSNDLINAKVKFEILSQSSNRPSMAKGFQGLAQVYEKEKNVDAAKENLLKSVQAADVPETFADLSALCLKQGQIADAEIWAQKSLEKDPDFPLGLVALTEVLLGQKEKDGARDLIKEALTKNPRSCDLHLEENKIQIAFENYQALAANARMIIALCPEDPFTYYYAGFGADKSYQKKEAQQYFDEYKRLGGDITLLPKGY